MAGFDYKWRLPTGGDATVAANWAFFTNGDPGPTPPGSADEAEFGNLGGTITGAITVGQWVIDAGSGFYTFAGNTTATAFQVGASAALTGTWTQTGTGQVNITAGTLTIGSQAALLANGGANGLSVVVNGTLIENSGTVTAADGIAIGIGGTGSLSETGGATLSAAALYLGVNAGANGTLDLSSGATATIAGVVEIGGSGGTGATVDIDAATLTAQGQMEVGLQSAGLLTIQDGGQLSTSASLTNPFLAVGGAGNSGTVDIKGSGSELNAGTNEVGIGDGGAGTLIVESGATLLAGGLFIANGSAGTVDLTGALTTVIIGTDVFGIGEGGTGQLTVQQGATLTVAGQLHIGIGSAGTFDIESGATLTSQAAELGVTSSANAPGTASVLLDAAQWLSSGQIVVGSGKGSTAELRIEDGATLQLTATLASTTPFLYVDEDIAGRATVDAGGTATVVDTGSNGVVIGNTGFGTLTLHDGARLTVGGSGSDVTFILGDQAGSSGSTTLTGPATTVDVTGSAAIGYGGAGTLGVGGTFTVGGNVDIAINATGSGTVDVSGSGSDLAIAGGLVIGGSGLVAGGTGSVTLTAGAALTAATLELHAAALSIDATSTAEIGTANDAVTGQLVVDTGITSGGSGTIAASVTNHGDLVAQSGTLTITGHATGNGIYDVAAGATFDLRQPGAVDIRFDNQTGTAMLGTASGAASITQFSGNDTLHITGIGTGATATYSGDTATITGSQGSWTFDFGAPAPSLEVTNQGADALVVACFAAGTLIATPSGETPVQQLSAGDAVRTQSGQTRRIVWIGTGRVLATRNRRTAATPVIVRKGALAPNVPHQDLRITKGHALYIDNVLIPVEFLVNHRSILWDDRAQEVTIYHIELETHDVLLANGAPAETYRDDGNRWLFQNANTGWQLPAQEPCAPVLTGGPILDAIWRRLLDRAGPRPGMALTEDPDLHLLLDGQRLDPASRHDTVAIFRLPAGSTSVRLISRAAAPAELGLARDPRMLGVAIKRIALRRGTSFRVIQPADPALTDGFHPFEPTTGLRWTDGDATLPAALLKGFHGPIELVLDLGGTAHYPLFGEPFRTAAA